MQINYPNERDHTRSVEIKHVTGQQHLCTGIAYEFPCATGKLYSPVPGRETAPMVAAYHALARQTEEK